MFVVPTEKVQEVKKNFLQESGITFSDLEEKVLQFHLSNLEFACGSSLDQVRTSAEPVLHTPPEAEQSARAHVAAGRLFSLS